MITTKWQAIGAGLFFLVVFLSGFWLSRSGKPYSGILINVHKLVALAAVVLFVITLVRLNRIATLGALEVAGGAVTVLLAIGLFVTGALVSIDHPMPPLVSTLHHLLPYLALLSTAATLYLLRGH
jgi:hypothetical protein